MSVVRFAASAKGVTRLGDGERVISPANAAAQARSNVERIVAGLAKQYGEAVSSTTRDRIAAEIADLRGLAGVAVMNAPKSVPMPETTTTRRVKDRIVPVLNSDGTVKRVKGQVVYREAPDMAGTTFQRRWSRNPMARQIGTPSDRLVPRHYAESAREMTDH